MVCVWVVVSCLDSYGLIWVFFVFVWLLVGWFSVFELFGLLFVGGCCRCFCCVVNGVGVDLFGLLLDVCLGL